MIKRVLLAGLIAMATAGGTAVLADDLNVETAHLERNSRSPKCSSDDARRLAEIYFLTSRCDDLKSLLKSRLSDDTKELTCACGGRCAAGTRTARLSKLRAALERTPRFEDRAVQALWREVSRWPEAQYIMLRYLSSSQRAYREPKLRQLRLELEKNLESLEVKP